MNGIIDSMDVSLSKLWEVVKDREADSLQEPLNCCSLDTKRK